MSSAASEDASRRQREDHGAGDGPLRRDDRGPYPHAEIDKIGHCGHDPMQKTPVDLATRLETLFRSAGDGVIAN